MQVASVIKNNFVTISGFLPTEISITSCCCGISFNDCSLKKVLITLEHEDLLDIFRSYSAPLEKRKYLIPKIGGKDYLCRIGNCEIDITTVQAELLSSAYDELYVRYIWQVKMIEEKWRSNRFRVYGNSSNAVPLIALNCNLWSHILKYVEEGNSDSESILSRVFDRKLIVEKRTMGVVASICVDASSNVIRNYSPIELDLEVVLNWEPPDSRLDNTLNSPTEFKEYWNAEETYDWVTKVLIPDVYYQAIESNRPAWSKFIPSRQQHFDTSTLYRNLKWDFFQQLHFKNRESLIKLLRNLELFYSNYSLKNFYTASSSVGESTKIYQLLSIVIKWLKLTEALSNGDGDDELLEENWQNLFNSMEIESWQEFEQEVLRRSQPSNTKSIPWWELKLIFICLSQSIENRIKLQQCQVEEIFAFLNPTIDKVYELEIFDRQFQRLDNQKNV